MSKLNEQQEEALSEYPPGSCSECGETTYKAFCGPCDQYYNAGHKDTCSRMWRNATWTDNHKDC